MTGKLARWIKRIAVTVVLLVIAGMVAFQVFFRLPIPDYTGTINIKGLNKPVEVRTDEHGVPHIFAENDQDLFFAQGYITARERMFQMDLTRLAGRGELSTVFGDKTVKTDRYFKTLGFYRAAEAAYGELSPASKLAVDAYTRGVNAYLDMVEHLPREYVILGAKPVPWKPADCLVGALLMSYRLNAPRGIKPLLHQVNVNAGPEVLRQLLPWVPANAPMLSGASNKNPIATDGNIPAPRGVKKEYTVVEDFYSPIILRMRASNWMAFAGSRTTTGKPVFTGSPDLEAAIPSLFYLVHMKGPSCDVIGGSIPGLPGVHALGFNGTFAWSITVGNADNLDFFIEKTDPENQDRYLTEKGYRDFKVIHETIRIKNDDQFNEEKLKIRISRHGPVVSEVMEGLPENCTMLWPGLMGNDGTLDGLLKVNRARSFSEFHHALKVVRGASVHVGYADVEGNIGYQYMSTLPVRKSGNNPVPVPGEKGDYDWSGFIPYEKHPYALNPRKGYVASFNQMPVLADYYGSAYFIFERPFRFEEMVHEKEKFSPEEIAAMQNDTGSYTAKRFIPLVTSACAGNSNLEPYVSMLKEWDCFVDRDSSGATLFNSFITHLIRNTFKDQLGGPVVEELYKDFHVTIPVQWLIRYMEDPGHLFWDDVASEDRRESRDDMIRLSMQNAVDELENRYGDDPDNWSWGKVHRMTIRHPLGSVLPFLNLGPYTYDGDGLTIHAGWWDRENPFDMVSGAAIRIVVDMADLSSMTFISPPGQSGHYLSPYYDDQAGTWSNGGQVPAHYTSASSLEKVLMLQPVE